MNNVNCKNDRHDEIYKTLKHLCIVLAQAFQVSDSGSSCESLVERIVFPLLNININFECKYFLDGT